MKSLMEIFRSNEVILEEEDLRTEYQPMTELEVFAGKTRQIVDGVSIQISDLELEIERAVHRLADLKRIRDGQALALRYMEGDV